MFFYTYLPLGPDSDAIRLLKVSSEPSTDGFISCSMEQKRVSKVANTYVAVSHVWGTEAKTFKILIDGKTYLTTPWLWSFLTLARQRVSNELLWIDAICTDQENIT